MKLSKDMLNALKIESSYVLCNGELFMCQPLEIRKNEWFVSCDSDKLSGEIRLKVKFNGSFIYLKAMIERKEQNSFFSFTYTIEISKEENNADNFKFVFFRRLSEMEEQANLWNKRKEERYDIGLDEKKIEKINFKSPEQSLVVDKQILPCIVNNISYSGAKITSVDGAFQKDKKICLYLSFVSPIEQIPLLATVKNCFIKSTAEKKIVSIISVKFDNPTYEYKKRLDAFIERL